MRVGFRCGSPGVWCLCGVLLAIACSSESPSTDANDDDSLQGGAPNDDDDAPSSPDGAAGESVAAPEPDESNEPDEPDEPPEPDGTTAGNGGSEAVGGNAGSGDSLGGAGNDTNGGTPGQNGAPAAGAGGTMEGGASGGENVPDLPVVPASARCEPLPAPSGDIVELDPSDDLAAAIAAAPAGTTLMLADGTYDVSAAEYIVFSTPGVTLRSQSGDPSSVVIDGGYQIGSILNVRADDITVAEMTLQHCRWHPIHVTGGQEADITGTLIYRVNVVDPGEQAIKINASDGYYADDGTIACSTLTLTDEGREHVTDCYTGGIDAHLARGWQVRDNRIEGFYCAEGLSEHAVHFWNSGRDTVVERNHIVDCARGIGFGLGENGNGTSRDYGDDACPGADFVGHYGGVIRNNMIFASSAALFQSQSGFDSGVALEQACGTVVAHNTVFSTEPPFVSMEYRFGNTDVVIANNLTSHRIMERDGGSAELIGNIMDATASDFVDASNGDLHLAPDSSAIGAAEPRSDVTEDFDGDARDAMPDVGCDEL